MTATDPTTERSRTGSKKPNANLIIAVLAMAGVTVALVQTILVPLIPYLPTALDVSPADASWLITATLMASAVATPSIARLADMYGKRRMMLVSLGGLLAGSILGLVASSLPWLIAARALQGFALALIPVAISIMRDEIPRQRLASAVALMSVTLGVGGAAGLPLSGFLYTQFGWHAVFWISVITALAMLVAVAVVVPESPVRTGGRFDLFGAILLSGALASLLLGITKGGLWGWSSASTLTAFLAAGVLTVLWVSWELHCPVPIVDVRTTIKRPVLLTNIASYLIGFAMFVNLLTTTQLLQVPEETGYGFGLSVMQAGIALLPAYLAMTLVAPLSAFFTRRYGPRFTLILGAGVLFIGYTVRIFAMTSEWQVILAAAVVSSGTSIAFAAMPVVIMSAVPVRETSAANGLNAVVRSIGTSTSSAAVAAILTGSVILLGGAAIPSFAAFQIVFGCAAVASLLGGVAAVFIPRKMHALTDS